MVEGQSKVSEEQKNLSDKVQHGMLEEEEEHAQLAEDDNKTDDDFIEERIKKSESSRSRKLARRQLADLDEMAAKVSALERLRNARRKSAAAAPNRQSGEVEENDLDKHVADSVFQSKTEKILAMIEARKRVYEGGLPCGKD